MNILTSSKITNTNNFKITDNFSAIEFSCKHCGELVIDKSLVEKLQKFRNETKTSWHISSGYRCVINNKNCGGASNSLHTKGLAADIYSNRDVPIFKYVPIILKYFSRVGIYAQSANSGFFHVDMSTKNLPTYWICDRVNGDGKYIYFKDISNLYEYAKNSITEWAKVMI